MKQRRNTKQRQRVLATVLSHKNHPSADQVFAEVRKESSKISRATVYRNLHLLAENNEVRQIKVLGVDRYDWRLEPHCHLVCSTCKKVIDAPIAYQAQLDEEISEQTGYEKVTHRTVFEGICPDCF